MIDKILDSFEQVQAKVKTEARELEDKLTKFGDSLDGYHDSIEEILKKFSNIILPLVQDDRKATLQTTLQTSIAKAKLGNVILNYPELIAWKETDTVQERSALIQEKITLLRPVLLALLDNDAIKSDEIIRIVHEMVDIGIVVPESFTGEDDALREHQLELIRPKVAQLSTIFSAKESPLLFTASSFKDIAAFVGKLKDQTDDVSPFLYSEFTAATQSLIDNYTISSTPSAALQEAIVTELNMLIQQSETIYESTRFNGVSLTVATEQLKDKHFAEGLQGTALIRYNRLLLDDAYPLELLGAYASDSTTSDSFVDTAQNIVGLINELPTDTYTEGMLYIAGKPFAIATPDVLTDHNPTVTYDLDTEDPSVTITEEELTVKLGKAEEGIATTVDAFIKKLSEKGISAHCIEAINPNKEKVTKYDASTGILTIAGAPFQIQPKDTLTDLSSDGVKYNLKVPTVQISGKKLTIKLGKVGSETTLAELKAILEADENINSVTLSNANKYTKLIEDASKVTSYNKDTGLLIIVGEQFQLSPINPWNLTNPILEVTYLQERGAAPIATVDDHSKELTLQLGAAGSRTTVQQLIDELKGKGSITDVIYTAPLIPAAPETTFKDYQTLTTTKYAALSNELDDLDGKVDFPPQVETTIEKIEQTVEELGLDEIDDSSALVTLLANKLRTDWLKDYPDYHFLVNTAEHLIIDWLEMDASADQFNEVFKIINSCILEISGKKLSLKFTQAELVIPAKTTVCFNLDDPKPRVTLNEDGALSITLGKAGKDSSLGQLKTALEKKLQEKDALAIVKISDSESNLLSDPTQPAKGWCTPKYELQVGGLDLLALLYKSLLIAKFIIDNRISIAYKEYEEVPADEGLDPSQEVGSTVSSEQGAATSPPDQGLPTPQSNVGQSGAQDTPAAYSPTPTSTAVNIDIQSIALGLLEGYWDNVIPFLAPDLQPWARHLQKGTLNEAISNILDVEGMMSELENRTNAFLKLFDYQLRPDSYNAATKELVIAGEIFTLSMATDKEDSLVDHIPTVTYDASNSTQPDVTINAADQTLTIALGAASTPTTAGQLKTALEQQPEIAIATLADFKVDTLLPEAYDAQVVPDSYNSATGEIMLTGRKFTFSGTALTDHTPKLVYDQDSSTPIVTVESNQTLTIQLGKKENPTPVAALESELEAKIGSVTSVIDHRGDQLLINNYDHSTQKLTLCGKTFTLNLASDHPDALQDHTPNVGLIIHAKPKVSIENDIFTIQLGVEESPTTVGLLKECLEKNVHIDTVTSDEEDHTELIPDDYTPANGELLISGQLLTLTLNTPEALNDQFLVVNYDQVTSTPTVAITADAFTISLGTASTPTTVNELKTALEANAKIASVAIDDGTKTLLPNSYDASTGELILSGKKVTIRFATGKEGMLTAAHLLIAKYRLEADTKPTVVINAGNKALEICIGSNAFPSSIYELKEVMEAMPEIESLEGSFPTLQTATRESIECIFPLLKSMISQVLGDYSDTDNEKSGSLAQVTEVPFKLAALFTELVLNHIPLPKGVINFLTGTPEPGEAPVSAGCLLLALPYAALEQVLEFILTTQEKEQQAA